MRFIISCLLIFTLNTTWAQSSNKYVISALFIGNSYTNTNNLPELVSNVATSTGDIIIFDYSAPGGYSLEKHYSNEVTLSKMKQGRWDYIIFQEYSQYPSKETNFVNSKVYPYSINLANLAKQYSPCGEVVFYRTWGRKYGDTEFCKTNPPVCTYNGMDSLLALRYKTMADTNKAIISPVGEVWKYIRKYHPNIELYNIDCSHPSPEGSYVAACCFYTTMLRKNPEKITYNFNLSDSVANIIKYATKKVVFDSLAKWSIGKFNTNISRYFDSVGKACNCSSEVKSSEIKIFFPNPAQDRIYLFNSIIGADVKIFDTVGVLLINKSITAVNSFIMINNLKSGSYIVEVNDKGNIKRQKLIKE